MSASERFRDARAYALDKTPCPVCGKMPLSKYYNEKKKAWIYKHVDLIKHEKHPTWPPTKRSIYHEVGAK